MSSFATMAAAGELDVNSVIDKLLDVRGARPGKQVNLSESDIRALCIRYVGCCNGLQTCPVGGY